MAITVKSVQKNKKVVIGALFLFLLIFFIIFKFSNSSVGPAQAENEIGFFSEPLQFSDMTVKLLKSSHNDNEHVFYFNVENAQNSAISTRSIYFTIKNKGSIYSSKNLHLDDVKLNPGMSTIATVTFKMKHADLTEGEPIMEVQRGLFFGEKQEFDLEK